MQTYEQGLYQFKSLQNKFINNGVMESDLPFLFEKSENKIGILILHGSESTPCNTYKLGEILASKGYTTLGVLFSGHGFNVERLYQGAISWKDCYQSAIEGLEILSKLVDKIYVIGSSFGGCIAYLMGIQFHKQISGVIAISTPSFSKYQPPSNLKWVKQVFDSIKAVEHNIHNLEVPTLILHSADDKVVKVNQALFAFDKIKTEQKKLIMYQNHGHSLGFGANTPEVAVDIDNFIKDYQDLIPVKFELDIDAYSVSVAGEFNNWSADEDMLFYNDGKWTVTMLLRKGDYQYKFIVNSSTWILDPKAETAITPRGKLNSLISVN